MNNVQSKLECYEAIEERIEALILDHSGLNYVEGSLEVVDGGAYVWSKLGPLAKEVQSMLYSDYLELTTEITQVLTSQGHPEIQVFVQSCEEVLAHIKQDTMSWDSSIKRSYERVQREIGLQKQLLTQPVNI